VVPARQGPWAACRAPRTKDGRPAPEQGDAGPGRWNQRERSRRRGQLRARVDGPSPRSSKPGPGATINCRHSCTERGWPSPPQPCPAERPWAAGLGLETGATQAGEQGLQPAPSPASAQRPGRVDQAHQAVRVSRLTLAWRTLAAPAKPCSTARNTAAALHPLQHRGAAAPALTSVPIVHGIQAPRFRRHRFAVPPIEATRCPAADGKGRQGHSQGRGTRLGSRDSGQTTAAGKSGDEGKECSPCRAAPAATQRQLHPIKSFHG